MRGVERDRKKVNKEITQCREKKKQTTDISTSILSIFAGCFFCFLFGSWRIGIGFDVWQMQTVSILPQKHFAVSLFHLLLHFVILFWNRTFFPVCSKSKATVFSVFPVFFIWFEDSLVLFLSVCSLVPSLFNRITCVKKPNKCDYVAVCRDMW